LNRRKEKSKKRRKKLGKREKIRPDNLTSRILAVFVTLDAGERSFPRKIERINLDGFIRELIEK
jgi:hypothetical protein